VYISLVIIECLILLTISIITLILSRNNSDSDKEDEHEISRYGATVAVTCTLGFLYFSVESIYTESLFQFWASIVSHLLITVYICYHYFIDNLGSLFHSISLTLLILVLVFQSVYAIIARKVHRSFGWQIYSCIGANLLLKRVYKTYLIYNSLLKLDCFLTVLLVMLSAFFLYRESVEFALNILILVLSLIWLMVGMQCCKKESKSLLFFFLILSQFQPIFIAWKLFSIGTNRDEYPH